MDQCGSHGQRIASLGHAAVATDCGPCTTAAGIRHGLREYEPGRYLTVVHGCHTAELQERGWTLIRGGMYRDGTDDLVCPHLAAEVR